MYIIFVVYFLIKYFMRIFFVVLFLGISYSSFSQEVISKLKKRDGGKTKPKGLKEVKISEKKTSLARESEEIIEIDGLIIDQTMSRAGREFYQFFYTNWKPPQGARNFEIRISEKPVPGRGTRVIVKVNTDFVFIRNLQPRYEIVRQTANQAVGYVGNYLRRKMEMAQALAEGDLQGDGI